MVRKSKAADAAYMRKYRKEKAAEARAAERYLADHLKIQAIPDFQSYMLAKDEENRNLAALKASISLNRWVLDEKKKAEDRRKMPSFLQSVVDEICETYPLESSGNREIIEAIVYQKYEQAQRHPEEIESTTFSARQIFIINELNKIREQLEEAKSWLSVYAVDLPKKEELYEAGKIKHFAVCMQNLKERGVSFYVARGVCGERFFDSREFYDRGWLPKTTDSAEAKAKYFSRSAYELGQKFWVEAEKADIDVDFIREWKEEDEESKQIEALELESWKQIYQKSEAYDVYEKVAHLSINQGLTDDKIMERLTEVGVTKIIDSYGLRLLLPGLRKELQVKLWFDVDKKIRDYLLEGLDDEQIVKEMLQRYVVFEDEMRNRVEWVKKAMRDELDETVEKLWTKLVPIKLRLKVKV